jgi:hypothetical protein
LNLSTKEVNYLKDHLSWELASAKRCYNYAQASQEQKISRLLDDIGQLHQQNFVDILNYCNQKAKEV